MDWMNFLSVMFGLVLRIGIPVAITILVFYWLNRMDQRWQEESEKEQNSIQVLNHVSGNTRCWETRRCSEESKSKCPAFQKQGTPCWQVFRRSNGVLKEQCMGCKVFQDAPVPIVIS
jgi:hypothetical protein